MSLEDEAVGPVHGATCTGDDVSASDSNDRDRQRSAPSALRSKTTESIWYNFTLPLHWCDAKYTHLQLQPKRQCSYLSFSREDLASGDSPFLKSLLDAEAAANAASIQLVSFKEVLEKEFSVCCQ